MNFIKGNIYHYSSGVTARYSYLFMMGDSIENKSDYISIVTNSYCAKGSVFVYNEYTKHLFRDATLEEILLFQKIKMEETGELLLIPLIYEIY